MFYGHRKNSQSPQYICWTANLTIPVHPLILSGGKEITIPTWTKQLGYVHFISQLLPSAWHLTPIFWQGYPHIKSTQWEESSFAVLNFPIRSLSNRQYCLSEFTKTAWKRGRTHKVWFHFRVVLWFVFFSPLPVPLFFCEIEENLSILILLLICLILIRSESALQISWSTEIFVGNKPNFFLLDRHNTCRCMTCSWKACRSLGNPA